jgi:ABC-type phosphate transport system substrate-binding protein
MAAVAGALVAVAATAFFGPARSEAATDPSTLSGEGGSFAKPIVNKLLQDGQGGLGGLSASLFDANVDQARSDFAKGEADFAVSEFPLTADEQATAKAAGRSFAYVPIAASPVAVASVVECETDNTFKSTTMCPDLELTVEQLAKLFTVQIGQWNSAELSTISNGKPIQPNAQSNQVHPELLADPSASTFTLISTFDAVAAAKTAWDTWLANFQGASDAPSETWPTSQGNSGGDQGLVSLLVPIDEATLQPVANPQSWGQGDLAPVPADWLGAPWDIAAHGMTIAVQNASGAFVSPTVAAASAALADATMDPATNLVTFPADGSASDAAAYPMMTTTYLIVPTTGLSPAKATALANLIQFALGSAGQKDISDLGAAPVSAAMAQAGQAVANELTAEASGTSTTTTTAAAPPGSGATSGSGTGASNGPSTESTSASATSSADPSAGGPSLAFTGGAPWLPAVAGAGLAVAGSLVRRRLVRRPAGERT